jgi:TonB family protein
MLLCSLAALVLSGEGAAARAFAQQTGAARPSAQSDELQEATRLSESVVKLFGERKYDEALPLARRALELRERALGPEHLLVGYALKNLGAVQVGKGSFGEAEKTYQRALDVLEKHAATQASSASDVALQLGGLKFRARDYGKAEALFERALALKEQAVGAGNRATVYALFVLADLHFVRDGFDKAEPFYQRALSILEKSPPQRDEAAARELKALLCHLSGDRGKEISKRVHKQLYRLDNPEQAAESERKKKETPPGVEGSETNSYLKVEGGVLNGRAVSKPQPSYPEAARRARAQGTVIVYIVVDERGKVTRAEALCGHELLKGASEDAARNALFTPTLLSGVPVRVTGVITYNFILR